MRLFVGIAIAEHVRQRLADFVAHMQATGVALNAKWVRTESLHVTLKFIGESKRVEAIQKQLQAVRSRPIPMTFKGVGFFTPTSPRIFWAGVIAGPELEQLATSIEENLVPVGVPREPHTYHEYQPHVTLARTGSGRPQGPPDPSKSSMWSLKNALAAQPTPEFGTMTAEEFILFRSETLPEGSRYTPLTKFPLK